MSIYIRLEDEHELDMVMDALRFLADDGLDSKRIDALADRIRDEKRLEPGWTVVSDNNQSHGVFFSPTFTIEEDARAWALMNDYSNAGKGARFDITEDFVYIIGPAHQVTEMLMADFGIQEPPVSGKRNPALAKQRRSKRVAKGYQVRAGRRRVAAFHKGQRIVRYMPRQQIVDYLVSLTEN